MNEINSINDYECYSCGNAGQVRHTGDKIIFCPLCGEPVESLNITDQPDMEYWLRDDDGEL